MLKEDVMANLKLSIERLWTTSSDDLEGIRRFHEQRSQLIKDMVDTLDLEVTSWIDTDSSGRPREVAEIIIALGSAGVFTAIVSAIRAGFDRNKIKAAVLEAPDGTKISVKGATADDIQRITRALGL
jgi:hypothetical protein